MRRLLLGPFAILLAAQAPALANDSEAAIGLGGLVLTQSDMISMDEEDLYISQKEVRVRYRFTNHSSRDIETLVSFPVPDLPGAMREEIDDRAMPDLRRLEFRTTVDGRPVRLDYVERAQVGERDVTARIAALGWPLRWFAEYPDSAAFLERLDAGQKAAFLREGLLRRSGAPDGHLLPAWNLVTHVTRRQVFPAGRSIEVTHRYVPLAGGSVGGNLNRQYRREQFFTDHVRRYCIDDSFLAGFDRRQANGRGADDQPFYMEHWLSYILSSGRNWRGPIGDFRLVVDKGQPGNLVSFCMDGVRKISPTQFEVRKHNFEPREDLEILIVEWMEPD